VGLSAILIATAMGAQVVAVDVRDEALELARTLGAVAAVNGRTTLDVVAAIRDLTHGGAHVSLDALGDRDVCRNSILSLRKRGRHVQVGLLPPADREPPVPMGRIVGWELEIRGSHGMAAHAYGPMLDLIVTGKLQPARLVRRIIALPEVATALPAMGEFSGAGVTVVDRL
jgi:alcohol dehydrogenase